METRALSLTPHELCAVVEATYDGLMERVRWSTNGRIGPWRELPLEVAQQSIDLLTSAYVKAFMELLDIEDQVETGFLSMFSIGDELMDAVCEITLANDWSEVPSHGSHVDCPVCDAIGA